MSLVIEAPDESLLSGPDNRPAKTSEGVYVRFHTEPVLNSLKSYGGVIPGPDGKDVVVEGAGRPIYDEVEFIEKVAPGDRTNIVDRPVRPEDKRQFAQQYKAWKAGDAEQLSGTPLSAWPLCPRPMVEELKHFRIRTVEQLAELSDANLQNIGPFRALRQKAQDWLAQAKGGAQLATLRSALEARDNEVDVLKRQVKELAEAAAKKGKQ